MRSAMGWRNSHQIGRIGQWAEDCAAQELVSIHFVNALLWPLVAPFGGADARFTTNPFCVGLPRGANGAAAAGSDAAGGAAVVPPMILDFATSKVAQRAAGPPAQIGDRSRSHQRE